MPESQDETFPLLTFSVYLKAERGRLRRERMVANYSRKEAGK